MTDADFKDFAEKIAEARKLLARSEVLARDTLVAEKQLGALRDQISVAEDRLDAVRKDTAQDEERFTHEKARHESALQAIIAECAQRERAATTANAQAVAQLQLEATQLRTEATTERRALLAGIDLKRAERDSLQREVETFKARIAAL